MKVTSLTDSPQIAKEKGKKEKKRIKFLEYSFSYSLSKFLNLFTNYNSQSQKYGFIKSPLFLSLEIIYKNKTNLQSKDSMLYYYMRRHDFDDSLSESPIISQSIFLSLSRNSIIFAWPASSSALT